MNVSAVIVTRGDVGLGPVIGALNRHPFQAVRVWDNSRGHDLGVYGRYAGALLETNADVIFVQDDDVILPAESIAAIVDAYDPGALVANMPERFRPHYPDSCLVGFGAIFDRDLVSDAFRRFDVHGYGVDLPLYYRTADVIFTALTEPRILLDVDYQDREFASAPSRMWKQPGHVAERQQMLELARTVRASDHEGAAK